MAFQSKLFDRNASPFQTIKPFAQVATPAAQPNTAALKPPTTIQNPTVSNPPQSNQRGFLQGNLIDKSFDVLRAPEYAISSFWKGAFDTNRNTIQQTGKGNIFSALAGGVKNIFPGIAKRTSTFGDGQEKFDYGKDVLGNLGVNNPTVQNAANVGVGFLMPSLPLAKTAGIINKGAKFIPGVNKIPGVINTAKVATTTATKQTPFVARAIEKFNPYFRRPELKPIVEGTETAIQTRLNNLYSTLKNASKGLSRGEQARIGQILEGGITATEEGKKLQKIAAPLRQLADDIGREAVNTGILSAESYDRYKGQYMTHIFQELITGNRDISSIFKNFRVNVPQFTGQFFKQRKGAEGYLREFAPAMFKGLGTEIKDIESAKMYQQIAKTFGVQFSTQYRPGYVAAEKVITNPKIQKFFKGLSIPEDVADFIKSTSQIRTDNVWDQALNIWKAGKTVWNPAYHFRNMLSNQILSDMSTGKGLGRTAIGYVRSVRNYFGKGNQKFVNAAEKSGLIRKKFFGAQLNEFIEVADLASRGKLKRVNDLFSKAQQITEDTAKLNVFRSWVEKYADDAGTTVDKALNDPSIIKLAFAKAEEAIFSPYRIGASERNWVSRLGIPFYSFTRQVVPYTAKTAVNNPERLTKYPRSMAAVESLSTSDVGSKDRPDYLKNQVRLPIKDKEGREVYFDPTYIFPFGNFGVGMERGRFPFGISPNPFLSEFFQQAFNYDPYFDQKIEQSVLRSKNIGSRIEHGLRSLGPTAPFTVKDKIIPAFQGKTDYVGRNRNKIQAILDSIGLKTSSADPIALKEKARKALLNEINDFKNEERRVLEDQRMTPQGREDYLNQLRKKYEQLGQ